MRILFWLANIWVWIVTLCFYAAAVSNEVNHVMSTVSVPAWFGSISMCLSMLRRMEKLLWRDDASCVQLVHWGSTPSLTLHLSALLTKEYKHVFKSPSSSLKQALLTTVVCKCFTENATTITKMIEELGIRDVHYCEWQWCYPQSARYLSGYNEDIWIPKMGIRFSRNRYRYTCMRTFS